MPSHSHKVSRDSGDPPAQPACFELPPDIRDELLDPAIWQEGLVTYALTTHLAVALTDAEGRLIGECINPQTTWSLLHANMLESDGGCPFSIVPLKPCTCVVDAFAKGGQVMVRGREGLVHFAVPLMLGEHQLGALVAGQVFDKYPEQLALNQEARNFDLSQQKVWQAARQEYPVKRATLKIYGDLLATLGKTFLQNRYHTIIEASRLDEMTRLRDLAVEEAEERKRAEKTLRAAEARFRGIAQQTNAGIAQTDLTGRFVFVNERYCQITGRSREELMGLRMQDITHPDDLPGNVEMFMRMVSGEKPDFIIEKRYVCPDGSLVWVNNSVSLIRDNDGQPQFALAAVIDITDRKRAEEARAHLAAIVEWSADAILSKTLEGVITSWNAGAERIFGYTAEEMIGQSIRRLIPPELQAEEDQILARLRVGESIEHYETVRMTKTGHRQPVSLTISPIKDSEGHILGASKIIHDISGRKQAEEEREQLLIREQVARAEAETANRMKDNFLATVSHELRTPLNAIFGWIQLMSNRTLDEETFARAVETIARNARSQARIIDDLMDISRIITGKLQLDVQSVDLVPVIEAAIDAVRLAADAKSIRLRTSLDAKAGPVPGDPNRLQQVIWNLLFNAIKFTPRQGSIEVELMQAESQVIITVGDTGQGISEELLPYIFDRFRQADSTSARKHGGLGLGLSIARQLVELHGGSIRADSPGEGQGTTFTVALPLMAARLEAGAFYPISPSDFDEMPFASAPALDGLRVLVVDDEAEARKIFRLMLEQCGAEVRTSASAAKALESLEQWRPDVLVSDIGMPGEDGYEMMRKVRVLETERGGQTPAVALTGYASVEDQKRALAAGYQMHMTKPVALIELATAVAILTGRAGSD